MADNKPTLPSQVQQATVTVPYQAPAQRAAGRLKTTMIDAAIAWLIVAIGLLIPFLQSGDFSGAAVRTLGIALLISLLTALVAYLRKLASATGDDAATNA